MAPGPTPLRERLVAIGNFDGVHLGHARLILGVVEQARAQGLLPCALTFHPHPARVLGRGAPRTLTRLARKVELLSLASPELEVVVQPFDHELSQSSPREFAEQLVRVQRARRVIVGENFRFGKDRKGSLATLRALGEELGFEVGSTELFVLEHDVVSSSRIRDAVEAGEVELAERLLGRPHRLIGTVVRGHGRGRKLGFPTANLAAIEELLPKNGVYAGRALVDGRLLPAVLNVGVRPTFAPGDLSVEVHVLDLSTLDSSELSFDIVARIRDERRFASVEELAAQIARDIDVARQRLGSDPKPG